MKTVYISIGNSGDKLSQHDWNEFIFEVNSVLAQNEHTRHGTWFSEPRADWQNACFCADVQDIDIADIRQELKSLAADYGQDSIAMAVVDEVEMVKP